jgi:pSer/pThr/pTyr-binding forkhead associated (FHA) protein
MNETGSVQRSGREAEYAVLISGVRFALPERSIIGRAPDADVCIATDRRVSRRHARLTICAHGVVIEDLGSKGGIYVDGERIEQSRLLVGGERIRLGHTELALLRANEDEASAKVTLEEKTVVPMSRAPADSGTFRTVDSTPHVLLTSNGE